MELATWIAVWLVIVIISMAITTFLAHRWGHEPFGWVLLSAALGPIAIIALIGTRQRDREVAARRTPSPRAPDGSIVVAVDSAQGAVSLVRHVLEGPFNPEKVVVLAVLSHEQERDETAVARYTAEVLTPAVGILNEAGLVASHTVRFGAAGEEIVRYADDANAAIILVGRRGTGLTRALLGSVSDYVVKHARQPVAVVS